MKLGLKPKDESQERLYTLTTREGRTYTLPVSATGANFSTVPDCPHCGGHAKIDGSYAGGTRPVRVIRGELYPHDRWLPCGQCAFGAARRRSLDSPRWWEDHPDARDDAIPAFPHGNRIKIPPPERMAEIRAMLKSLYARCAIPFTARSTWEAPQIEPVQPEDQGEPVPECLL